MNWAFGILLAAGGAATVLQMPGGEAGIGFDDLTYSPALQRVLVPAGRTGRLDLVDPRSLAIQPISGFSSGAQFRGGHGEGTTSADATAALIFASDRDRRLVRVFDAHTLREVGSAQLEGTPDYVRWVQPLGELWVTLPGKKEIEFFALEGQRLIRKGRIEFPDGPESLVIDSRRGRAYSNSWRNHSYAIDLRGHRIASTWTNGCKGSRGIALDEERGWLFVGCDEGAAVSLDVSSGKQLGAIKAGAGVDIIAYAPKLRHLYVPGGDSATMLIASVGPDGALSPVRTVPTAEDVHCATTSGDGRVFVCAPKHGQLLVIPDVP